MNIATRPPVDLGADTDLLGDLMAVWQKRRRMNLERSLYFDGEQALKDFGISLPPQMTDIGAALGWIGKGVKALTNRSQFERFVTMSGSEDALAVEGLLWDNQFRTEFPAACISSAVHGCSFLTVSHGDLESGEPDVLVTARAAEDSAAIYDRRKRGLRGFLSIIATEYGHPVEMVMYTPELVYMISKTGPRWNYHAIPHHLGETPAYPLVHGFELRRPLGHSRITRASMYFADAALRTIIRSEISAELYAAPEYYLFGTDVQSFIGDDRWTALLGRIKALNVDTAADEKFPEVHRFTGESPQPHVDQLRMFASQFADEMDLDVRYADSANPSSAEAIFAAKETLITGTKNVNESWGHGGVNAINGAIRLRDGLDENTDEMKSLRAQFTDPVLVSPSARADAFSKFVSAVPEFGESEVGLEYGGLSSEQITRFKAEQRRKGSALLHERIRETGIPADGEGATASDEELKQAQIAKAKGDALGAYRRAGVEGQAAAKLAGITEPVDFIPGNPITIRETEQ
ncbi:phage portal protein [Leucobacter viscericola]|uniref:Phage portal protein n=1 Tax=Leucobacter viscericola TaxID=2714935 RepID=A0A6G7XDA2_9MICO|nr:phage portal protein [Leucobacter viscericola]QIK62351.1 phage portal protein [Leucobacter viscericola]